MNLFARFNENPAMTLQDIKETKRYGRTDGCTDGRTDGQRENSIPPTNKVCGGYKESDTYISITDFIGLSTKFDVNKWYFMQWQFCKGLLVCYRNKILRISFWSYPFYIKHIYRNICIKERRQISGIDTIKQQTWSKTPHGKVTKTQ